MINNKALVCSYVAKIFADGTKYHESVKEKTLHPSLHGAGRGNPRIAKARSSHGIAREHE